MEKIKKEAVLYLYKPNKSDYSCSDCSAFISSTNRCLFHGITDEIKPNGSCGLWIMGRPLKEGTPRSQVDKTQSGYVEAPNGFSCSRCEYFVDLTSRCKKVEGHIESKACCNAWNHK